MSRKALFKLYQEAQVEKNKSGVLEAQLHVMQGIGKLKNLANIPLEGGDK